MQQAGLTVLREISETIIIFGLSVVMRVAGTVYRRERQRRIATSRYLRFGYFIPCQLLTGIYAPGRYLQALL